MKLRWVVKNIVFLSVVFFSTLFAGGTVIFFNWVGISLTWRKRVELLWARTIVWASGIKLQWESSPFPEGNYIFISNHESYLDIPVLVCVLHKFSPRFVAKSSLFNIPIFGWALKAVEHIPLHRENRKKGLRDLQRAIEASQRGESVLVFPEGTRNPHMKELLEFQVGAFILAIRSSCPIVPVVLHGTGEVLPRGTFLLSPSKNRVVVKVLSPIFIGNMHIKQREELKDRLWNIMQKEFLEIKDATR